MSNPFGLLPLPNRRLPVQKTESIILHAERFLYASRAQSGWADKAKKAVEYYEGKQWAAADMAKLQSEGRPALTINKIRPLVNLVVGYHLNRRSDITYLPGFDGTGTAEIASALSHVSKHISQRSQGPYVDAEVFLDGLLAGRGYWDGRLSYENNDLGELIWMADDPFATYPDPEAFDYDLNKGNYVITSRWVSIDEAEYHYGKGVADMLRPLVANTGFSGMPTDYLEYAEEVTPWRRFGGEADGNAHHWGNYGEMFFDWADPARKTLRLLDIQHYVNVKRMFFIDLETGDKKPVPDHWPNEKIMKVVQWSEEQGNPLIVQQRMDRRCRWTHMIGDVMVYDDWSRYRTFTKVPYFPYFRRGQTQGMVEHLTDSQDEINKRRSARLNIVGRTSAGGWIYPKGALDAQGKANLELYGSTPGVHIEYDTKGGRLRDAKPEQITPPTPPLAHAQLEQEAEGDLKAIAGINDAALGQVETVQSGRSIEAKQRQSIVGLEGFMDNYKRSKCLQGDKQLEVVQNHYTEQRVLRVIGEGNTQEQVIINQRTAAGIINNVTLGRYTVTVDETPLSRSFLEAQFEELMRMKEIGMPIPDDFVIDASSLGRKTELKEGLNAAREAEAEKEAMALAAGGKPPTKAGPGGAVGPGAGRGKAGGNLPVREPGSQNVVPLTR